MDRTSRLGFVGAGSVGSAIAWSLAGGDSCGRIVLYDIDHARAAAEAWDLADGASLGGRGASITAVDAIDGLAGSDIVVITAGAKQHGEESRLALLDRNAALIGDVIPELDRVVPGAVLVIVTNPVDVITRIAMELSSRPPGRIIGSGTLIDSSRLRVQLALAYGLSPSSVDAAVIGEHGESSLAAWTSVTIGSVRLDDLPIPAGRSLAELKSDAMKAVRSRGRAIREGKGFTNYGIAAAIARIVDAITADERAVLPVSVRAIEPYDLGTDVVLSLPSVIGRQGIVQTILIALDAQERADLARSAHVLDDAYAARTRSAGIGASVPAPRLRP